MQSTVLGSQLPNGVEEVMACGNILSVTNSSTRLKLGGIREISREDQAIISPGEEGVLWDKQSYKHVTFSVGDEVRMNIPAVNTNIFRLTKPTRPFPHAHQQLRQFQLPTAQKPPIPPSLSLPSTDSPI
jgi:hypothetical protein